MPRLRAQAEPRLKTRGEVAAASHELWLILDDLRRGPCPDASERLSRLDRTKLDRSDSVLRLELASILRGCAGATRTTAGMRSSGRRRKSPGFGIGIPCRGGTLCWSATVIFGSSRLWPERWGVSRANSGSSCESFFRRANWAFVILGRPGRCFQA